MIQSRKPLQHEVQDFCLSNDRISPTQDAWLEFYRLLNEAKPSIGTPAPPKPILAQWHTSPIAMKMIVLREQIGWAGKFNCLELADQYLRSLSEDLWFHRKDRIATLEQAEIEGNTRFTS